MKAYINVDIDSSDIQLRFADKSTRLANHVVDMAGICFIVFLHAVILDGVLGIIPEDGSPLLAIYFFVLYVLYYVLFEHFFGKTPGKFLSKTHVKTIYGQRPSFTTLLGRNLSRLIPLDNFSFLFSNRGWHDTISKTCVVYDA